MTEKQFSILRTTIIGAAVFIGGAVLHLGREEIGMLFMVFGSILMLKDVIIGALVRILEGNLATSNTDDREKEEQTNDPN